MKLLKKITFTIFFMVFLPLIITAEPIKKIRVGTTPNYAPLIFKQKGQYYGIEAELAKLLAKEFNCEIEYVEVPMGSIIQALDEGKIDMIMSGLSVTLDRQSQVQFLFPFLTISQMALIRKNDENKFESVDDIYYSKLNVGFEKSTTGEIFVKASIPNAKHISFDSPDLAVQALKEKTIDLFIYDSPLIWKITNDPDNQTLSGLFWPLTEEDIAWAVHKDNAKLSHAINTAILKWKLNGSLTKIINRWIKIKRTFVAWGELEES